jgi:NAD(P)-dependent dehydrogenase (short-subunit alcohol dehydrogenase family)
MAAPEQFARETFAGRTALVTGGGTGLGLAISRGLAALGAHVVIASRSSEHHQPFLEEARARGWSAEAHVLDVREAAEVERLAAARSTSAWARSTCW